MDENRKSEKLKKEKDGLIRAWMGLQDQAEGLNERLFSVSLDIEKINARILQEIEKEEQETGKKNRKAKAAARNGNAQPK